MSLLAALCMQKTVAIGYQNCNERVMHQSLGQLLGCLPGALEMSLLACVPQMQSTSAFNAAMLALPQQANWPCQKARTTAMLAAVPALRVLPWTSCSALQMRC